MDVIRPAEQTILAGVTFRPASKEKRRLVLWLKDLGQKRKLARELIRLLRSHNIWAKMRDRREGVEVLVRDRDFSRALRLDREFALDIDVRPYQPRRHNLSKPAGVVGPTLEQ